MNTTQYIVYSSILAIVTLLVSLSGIIHGQSVAASRSSDPLPADTLASQVGYFLDERLSAPLHQLTNLSNFIADLQLAAEKKRNKRDLARHIFYRTQQKYLKRYRQFSSLGDLLEDGNFDCVSASALYGIIFTMLDIDYQIQETDYHVYIMIFIDGKEILIETTDRRGGFVEKQRAIEAMLKRYQRNRLPEKVDNVYTFSYRVNGPITLRQLAGLQLYNLAVCRFNGQDFETAQSLIDQALTYYRSGRIMEFKELMAGL